MSQTLDTATYPVQIDRSYVIVIGAASDGADVCISAWRGIGSDRTGLKRTLTQAGFGIDARPDGTVWATRIA
ncbi:hypothetical protein [Mycobacteroides abscessus]|uniref:hypothetical protein n=1 Tax=Mycobacteroides abscessus TaxID=36809 RepID=UPI00149013A5|nr:hypothetical protein [Mycobacteroides abscessus]